MCGGGWTYADVIVRGLDAGDWHEHRLDLQDGGEEGGGGHPLRRELVTAHDDRQQLKAFTGRGPAVHRSYP